MRGSAVSSRYVASAMAAIVVSDEGMSSFVSAGAPAALVAALENSPAVRASAASLSKIAEARQKLR